MLVGIFHGHRLYLWVSAEILYKQYKQDKVQQEQYKQDLVAARPMGSGNTGKLWGIRENTKIPSPALVYPVQAPLLYNAQRK